MAAAITRTTKTTATFKGFAAITQLGAEFTVTKHGKVTMLRAYINGHVIEGSARKPLVTVRVPAGTAPRTSVHCTLWAVRLVEIYIARLVEAESADIDDMPAGDAYYATAACIAKKFGLDRDYVANMEDARNQ